MKLNDALLLKLGKKYEPSSVVELKFRGKDLAIRTDDEGNAVVLFIGKTLPDGRIKGERYTRNLVRHNDGSLIKDHWDHKGKT